MNDLARMVPMPLDSGPPFYRVMDRNGQPWWVVKDICAILGIKNPSDAVKKFPPEWVDSIVCDIDLIYITYAKPRARKTQRVLIVNYSGAIRLISRSRKPEGKQLREALEKFQAAVFEQGFNRACLPKTWYYRGQMLNHAEWLAKKEEAYFKRFPNADFDDFLRTLPVLPPVPPEEAEKAAKLATDSKP
jgi:hypothetical protein